MGGNVFKGKTDRIKREDIPQTLDNYYAELSKIFPKKKKIFQYFKPVGSVGKKPTSGDIDLAIDAPLLVDKNFSDESIKEWDINPQDVKDTFENMKKRAKSSTDAQIMLRAFLQQLVYKMNSKTPNIYADEKKVTSGNIFSLFPQYDENNKKLDIGVQIDWMVGDVKWLEFSYYSEEYSGNVKGLHRTQLVLSMFQTLGLMFKHADGVIDKETRDVLATNPKDAIKILNERYNIKLTDKIIKNYFELRKYIEKHLDKSVYESILDTYLRILDRTRCDIPEDLQQYWKDNQSNLNLSGKFLPDDSRLLREGSELPSFKKYLVEAAKNKPTPQLKNLKKDELIDFLDSFINNIDSLSATEKLAGQLVKVKYDLDNNQTLVAPKSIDGWKVFEKYNYHKDVMTVLDKFFQKKNKEYEFSCEVLGKDDVHDYISYDLDVKIVVEFTGALTDTDIKELNKVDKSIRFMSREDIKVKHTSAIKRIEKLFNTKWKKQIEDTKTLKDLRTLILPEIQDELGSYIADEFGSAINSSNAVEGFFMTLNGKGLKLPNKVFADLQRINVGVVNIMKMPIKKVKERIQDKEDRLVLDMVNFLENNISLKFDEDKYKRLMSVEQSQNLLSDYEKTNDTLKLYTDMRKLIK